MPFNFLQKTVFNYIQSGGEPKMKLDFNNSVTIFLMILLSLFIRAYVVKITYNSIMPILILSYSNNEESINNFRHDISHGFIVKTKKMQIRTDFQSSDYKFFKRLPKNLVPHHKIIIKKAREIVKLKDF